LFFQKDIILGIAFLSLLRILLARLEKKYFLVSILEKVPVMGGRNLGSVAKNVFEGKKGEYLWVAQTRIVNFTGVF